VAVAKVVVVEVEDACDCGRLVDSVAQAEFSGYGMCYC